MLIRHSYSLKWFLKIEGWYILFFIVYGSAICILNLYPFFEGFTLPIAAIGFLGTAVAILLGFRNNSAYERFWEARKAWGDLTNVSRYFASQVITYIRPPQNQVQEAANVADVHQNILFRHLAFVNALRLQLLNDSRWDELKPWLPDDEFQRLEGAVNKATQLNHLQAQYIRDLHEAGWITSKWYVVGLIETLKEAYRCQGISERIKNTPLLRQYSFFTKHFVWMFVLLLPLGLVQHLGWQMIPVYVALATVFTTTERIGGRTEDPFDKKMEDIPLHAICRTIEIDLKQQLGESSVPPPVKPQHGVLM